MYFTSSLTATALFPGKKSQFKQWVSQQNHLIIITKKHKHKKLFLVIYWFKKKTQCRKHLLHLPGNNAESCHDHKSGEVDYNPYCCVCLRGLKRTQHVSRGMFLKTKLAVPICDFFGWLAGRMDGRLDGRLGRFCSPWPSRGVSFLSGGGRS